MSAPVPVPFAVRVFFIRITSPVFPVSLNPLPDVWRTMPFNQDDLLFTSHPQRNAKKISQGRSWGNLLLKAA